MDKIVFVSRISRMQSRKKNYTLLYIAIPKSQQPLVRHGKKYKVVLEPLEDDGECVQ